MLFYFFMSDCIQCFFKHEFDTMFVRIAFHIFVLINVMPKYQRDKIVCYETSSWICAYQVFFFYFPQYISNIVGDFSSDFI